jgi:hypothetical protein
VKVVEAGMRVETIKNNSEVHSRLADFALSQLCADPVFSSIFGFLDFSKLRYHQIYEIFQSRDFVASAMGLPNFRCVVDCLYDFQITATKFLEEVKGQVRREVGKLSSGEIGEELSQRFDRRSQELRHEFSFQLQSLSEQARALSEELEQLKMTCESLATTSRRQANAVDRLRGEVRSASSVIHDLALGSGSERPTISRQWLRGTAHDIVWVSASNVLGLLADHIRVKGRVYKSNVLMSVLTRRNAPTRWSSDPRCRDYPSFTIEFTNDIRVRVEGYRLSSGFPGEDRFPHARNWKISGQVADTGTSILMAEEKMTDILVDGQIHQFEIGDYDRFGVNEITFAMTGRNKLSTSQLHIGYFTLIGYVIGPRRVLESINSIRDLLPCFEASGGERKRAEHEEESDAERRRERERDSDREVNCDRAELEQNEEGASKGESGRVKAKAVDDGCLEERGEGTLPFVETSESEKKAAERRSENERVLTEPNRATMSDAVPHRTTASRSVDEERQEVDAHVGDNGAFVAQVAKSGGSSNMADGNGSDNPKDIAGGNENAGGRGAEGNDVAADNDGQGAEGEKLKLSKGLITEYAGIEEIRELSSSRFGAVRLVRRRSEKGDSSEFFAAKFYNAGDSNESRSAFMERVYPFICLNHPSVMPICGMIAPTKGTGPIVLTRFSEYGSLEDVLTQVRKNEPPLIWNNCTITKILFNLITGLEYLHRQGIVHRELKPSDIIIEADGSARICGYLTSFLEKHKFTKASRVGSPFYMAPEAYDDEERVKSKDPKTDVFSFGLIAFELVAIARVFPSSMHAATIMRKVMSARFEDRPKIADSVPRAISELILRCWVPLASTRPTFEDILHQMNTIQFRFFPDVDLRLTMPISSIAKTSLPLFESSPNAQPVEESSGVRSNASKTGRRDVSRPH